MMMMMMLIMIEIMIVIMIVIMMMTIVMMMMMLMMLMIVIMMITIVMMLLMMLMLMMTMTYLGCRRQVPDRIPRPEVAPRRRAVCEERHRQLSTTRRRWKGKEGASLWRRRRSAVPPPL